MRVSLIILNYNSSGYTLDCVASIRRHTRMAETEIIVVDNGSREDDFEALHSLNGLPSVRLVRSRLNLGFSGGHSFGLQFTDPSSAYYFFLNNDCLLLDDVCTRLYAYMEAHRNVGVCTAQAINRADQPEPSFGYFPRLSAKLLGHAVVRKLRPAHYPPRKDAYREPVPVPVVTGSAMFVRATAFWQVGGFDPAYFLFCEEEDICRRLNRAGWSAVLVPDVRFRHIGGGSTNRNLLIEKEYYLSLFYYFRKYESNPTRLALQLFYLVKVGRKSVGNRRYRELVWFLLRGAPVRESLRYQQGLAVIARNLLKKSHAITFETV
ncbi:glycosyltransferase family 2 protein [Larkinella soli]|uniref:glycosyltransferase family 2 protein n=1 Tax=Larkinella soli TaxID=1770527 RepID=UPI000FFB8371|nr:glycosyltransferase family 2 protein [Larkinella soli]